MHSYGWAYAWECLCGEVEAYTWSNRSVEEKVGLSVGDLYMGKGLTCGEIGYFDSFKNN